jgi:anthranilate phosphoribosyltransferase
MSDVFRELLRKVGSGVHTSKNLSRAEAETAMTLMLEQVATPAQIGAFLIAHRIKRPTGEELAGMLDACDRLGPALDPIADTAPPVAVLGIPYDGRSRTAPLSIPTALLLATVGQRVLLHGGERMPTKAGVPLVELWRSLGVDWSGRSLSEIRRSLERDRLGFVYLPRHFPAAHALVPYRDQIGKRPPLASLELMWSPYRGQQHQLIGFVHPRTEQFMAQALAQRGVERFTTLKGLEGSCELPCDRTAIIGQWRGEQVDRLCLSPRDHGYGGSNVPLVSTPDWARLVRSVLAGEGPEDWMAAIAWNTGFYLWRLGWCDTVAGGLSKARHLLQQGTALATLDALIRPDAP